METHGMGEGDGLLVPPPPTEYRRMLSWQLSHVQGEPVSNPRRRARRERERRKKRLEDSAGEDTKYSHESERVEEAGDGGREAGEEEEEEEEEFAYLVINSEGEEECYYSAAESPPDSEYDGVAEAVGGEVVCLPPQERKRGGRSKKAKKRVRSVVRLAEVEFFGPLCDLVEGSLEVDVTAVDVSNQVDVPSLAELCVRNIHKAKLVVKPSPDSDSEDEPRLPYLIQALLGAHRVHRSLVGTQVRWLERMLAAWEIESAGYVCQSLSPPLAYCLRPTWTTENITEPPSPVRGLHLPLPFVSTTTINIDPSVLGLWGEMEQLSCLRFTRHVASLVHFADFLYPLFTLRGARSDTADSANSLSPSQTEAVAYVNRFLSSRYKVLCKEHVEFLKLWPGYVYWARGQAKLALSAFTAALDSLKYDVDRAVVLNEMGRMLLMFGDRYTASLFFSKSGDLEPLAMKTVFEPHKEEVPSHVLALHASLWDCGLLTAGVARQAAQAWSRVLQSIHNHQLTNWFLHVAAVESRMMVHSGVPVGSQPEIPQADTPIASRGDSSLVDQWMTELLNLLSTLSITQPMLHYHHSLLLAMAGKPEEARKTFLRFCDDFLLFREWSEGTGFPGDPFSTVVNRRLLNPWLPLYNMLNEQGLTQAPLLKLKWRTRLLYPMYPYTKTQEVSYLADHCSSAVNLRLSDTGYITADLQMDLPPLRSVFLDPYTGSVCFSRSASLHHYLSGPVGNLKNKFIIPDEMAVPWPLRLLDLRGEGEEWEDGVMVDLVISGCVDSERHPYWTNQCILLHWYCGSLHSQLDLRLAIRKELKRVLLDCAKQKIASIEKEEEALRPKIAEGDFVGKASLDKLEESKETIRKAAEMVSPMMQRGFTVSTEIFARERFEVPSKYVRYKEGKEYRKERSCSVTEFNLTLTEYVVYAEATLALFFTLESLYYTRDDQWYRHALVVINCSSRESFLKPRVYCSASMCGFLNVHPSNQHAVLYPSRHMPHIRHLVVFQYNGYLKTCSQSLLDCNGDVVYHHKIPNSSSFHGRNGVLLIPDTSQKFKFSMGNRVFHWSSQNGVVGFNLHLKDGLSTNLGVELKTVVPVPGCLLVHTITGLSL